MNVAEGLYHGVDPPGEGVEQLSSDFGISPSTACRQMEGMIAVLDGDERGALAEFSHELAHERDVGKRVAGALQEQHRDFHGEEMRCPLLGRAPDRVQRKAEESEAKHTWK